MGEEANKTLFVRNLPYNTTNEILEQLFSDVGPIKSCFVVKDKETGKCRGFGYVKYSMREDAEKAKAEIKTLNGRKLLIHFAGKKLKPQKLNKSKKSQLDEDASDEDDQVEQELRTDNNTDNTCQAGVFQCRNKLAKEKHKAACTVIVRNFDPESFDEHLKSVLTGLKNIRKIIYPVEDQENNVAAVIMKSKRDALKAAKQLDKMKVLGQTISAVLLSVEISASKERWQPKKCRLIIRNLSFSCDEKKLKKAFAAFGEITDVVIPKKPDGKMFGFGFVQFATVDEAKTAITEMNAKLFLGRPIAVDWAVPKNKYERVTQMATGDDQSHKSARSTDRNKGEDTVLNQEEKKDIEKETSSESEEDYSSDTEAEGEEESAEELSKSGDDLQSDEESNSDSDTEIKKNNQEDSTKKPPRRSDVDQGRTLFIRNLSFDTEEEDLLAVFEEFGEVNYCCIVIDPETDHSRGTAFVQFKQKSDADKVLEAADPEKGPGLVIDGRKVTVLQALPRDRAIKLRENKKKKEEKDNRNLYLAREGMIRPGTKAAEGLTPADLNMRMKIDAVKRQKLKNPNIFISPTRLCVHNIPLSVDDKQLKKAMLKAVDDKSAKITECRIMRDMSRVNSSGVARSRGYAFVAFTEHKHALKALHATNNNPDVFGGKRRPIVEFSLENRAALVAKQKRQERSKIKMEILKKTKDMFADVKIKRNKNKRKLNSAATLGDVYDEERESLEPTKKKIKGLPSHWGPKIRHRNRGQDKKPGKKPKDRMSRRQKLHGQRDQKRTNDTKPKKQRMADVGDNLDKLINKYRQRFSKDINDAKRPGHKSKWFE